MTPVRLRAFIDAMDSLPRPSGRDLSGLRVLTVMELQAARDALVEAARSGEPMEEAIVSVFALLMEGGPVEHFGL